MINFNLDRVIACGNHKTRKRPADNSQKWSLQSPKFSLEIKRFSEYMGILVVTRASTRPRFQGSVLGLIPPGNEVKLQLTIIC